jgi:hypothetical protein
VTALLGYAEYDQRNYIVSVRLLKGHEEAILVEDMMFDGNNSRAELRYCWASRWPWGRATPSAARGSLT